MSLSKQDILDAQDRGLVKVSVPEWGGHVYVQSMTALERDAFEESLAGENKRRNLGNLRARLVVKCACDDKGNRIFTADDAAGLGAKCAAPVDRIFEAARRLSGMTDEDVEELEKNLEGGMAADSPTD